MCGGLPSCGKTETSTFADWARLVAGRTKRSNASAAPDVLKQVSLMRNLSIDEEGWSVRSFTSNVKRESRRCRSKAFRAPNDRQSGCAYRGHTCQRSNAVG